MKTPRTQTIKTALILMLTTALALLPAAPVQAATVIVNISLDDLNGADGGNCASGNILDYENDGALPLTDISLREAICWANNNPGPDVVNLPNTAFLLSISGPDEDANLNGDLDITDDLTINGNGAIVRGGGLFNVFHIVTPGITVSFNNIQVEDGNAGADYGGGLHNNGANVTLTDSTITHNSAFRGGGIYTTGGSLTLDNTNIDDTAAKNIAFSAGGGIYSTGTTLTLTNGSAVSNNEANSSGGGIYHFDGLLTIEGSSVVSGNQSGADGGGIYISTGGSLTIIENSSVETNQAENDGGGIYMNNEAETLTVEDSTIQGNIAGEDGAGSGSGNGGGIFNDASGGTATIRRSTISYGEALDQNFTEGSGSGGCIFNDTSGDMLVEDSEINLCYADYYGGGIFNAGNLEIANSSLTENIAPEGGGLNTEGTAALSYVTFQWNEAFYGGGMQSFMSSPTLTNVTFTENFAGDGGGGLNNYIDSSPTLTNVIFDSNEAFGYGGGISNEEGSSPTLTNVTFSNNTAFFGAGMDNYFYSSPSLTNTTFFGNTADYGGGMNNEYNSSPLLVNVTFNGNSAVIAGGAINNFFNSSPTLINVILWGDTAPTGPEIANDDFLPPQDTASQSDDTQSDDTHSRGQHQSRAGKPLENDTASDLPGQTKDSIPDILDSVVQGGCPADSTCTNIITEDPLLGTLADNGGFTRTIALAEGSPAIDTGNAAACPADDQRGVVRPQGDGCDIGAYEFEVAPPPPTEAEALPDTGFARGTVTKLPAQPADKAYTASDLVLHIPELGIEMDIVGVPLTGGAWDTSWLGQSAGWLEGSAFPTWEGNTILTGHVWDTNNNPGPFAEIKDLQHGDQITISAWGQTYTYEVRESSIVFPGRVEKVFQHEEYDYLTLLTCEFYNPLSGNYIFRRVVRAVLVEVQ